MNTIHEFKIEAAEKFRKQLVKSIKMDAASNGNDEQIANTYKLIHELDEFIDKLYKESVFVFIDTKELQG